MQVQYFELTELKPGWYLAPMDAEVHMEKDILRGNWYLSVGAGSCPCLQDSNQKMVESPPGLLQRRANGDKRRSAGVVQYS